MTKAMKDSGIEWIGEIPEDWSISRIKNVASLYTGNSIKDEHKDMYTDKIEAKPYIATKDIEAGSCVINYDNGLYVKHDDESFKIATKGSSLMCIEGGSAGRKKAFLEEDVAFVNKLCCLSPFNVNEKFLFQFICSKNFEDEFTRHISGLIGGVSVSALKNFNIALPSMPEQQKIADFLDEKCGHIDSVLEKTKASIEEYKQLKQSVITQAVTKGIRPNRPMKDSGIEWIGEIPEDWEICKLKYLTSLVTDGSHIAPDTSELKRKFVSVADMNEYGDIDFDSCLKITEEQYQYLKRTGCKPKCNDILISKDGTIGKTTIVKTQESFVVASSLVIIRPKNNLNSEYLRYILMSENTQRQLNLLVAGTALKRVSVNKNANLLIVNTLNMNEQQEIVTYLDDRCSEIDKLIAKKEQLIEELEIYKKSLIYEYVTGKKEVC
ncbi:restriction endonuclease subunit S [bacterium]|nr:restriction endonuclease subunit S [bacterium]